MEKIIALAIIALLSLTACATEAPQSAPAKQVIINTGMDSSGEAKEFEIIARQFSFEPNLIEVNKGDTVRIRARSIDVDHSIAIAEYDIDERIPAGGEVQFEFVADKAGEFEFRCSIYCGEDHRKMLGTLIVK